MTPEGPPTRRNSGFYDDASIVNLYLEHRHRPVTSPNVVMEEPAFTNVLGGLEGLHILELGCGDASFGRTAADQGCRSYLENDSSPRMVAVAERLLEGSPARVELAEMERFHPDTDSFDLVVARMALHYLHEPTTVLERSFSATRSGGRFVGTVAHPAVTASTHPPSDTKRTSIQVDDYFSLQDPATDRGSGRW
jgi:SAM-dependent methyltransferase